MKLIHYCYAISTEPDDVSRCQEKPLEAVRVIRRSRYASNMNKRRLAVSKSPRLARVSDIFSLYFPQCGH